MLELLKSIDAFAWGPPLLILLVGTGIYLTARLGRKAGYIAMPLVLSKNKLEGLGQTQNLQEA